jgi:hypothetical protein
VQLLYAEKQVGSFGIPDDGISNYISNYHAFPKNRHIIGSERSVVGSRANNHRRIRETKIGKCERALDYARHHAGGSFGKLPPSSSQSFGSCPFQSKPGAITDSENASPVLGKSKNPEL